jgi:hypothetical protein
MRGTHVPISGRRIRSAEAASSAPPHVARKHPDLCLRLIEPEAHFHAKGAAHSSQKFAPASYSYWHPGHFTVRAALPAVSVSI